MTLHEELAQINYIFTDKTGTITQNKLEFKKFGVLGYEYAGSNIAEIMNNHKEKE